MKTQVEKFDNVTGDNLKDCNDFLGTLGANVLSVNTFYDTILGGVIYVVVYFENKTK